MVISKIVGGLGNQLFGYAAGRALSLRRGVEFKLDAFHFADEKRPTELAQYVRSYKLPQFQISTTTADRAEIARLTGFVRRGKIGRVLNRAFRSVKPFDDSRHYRETNSNFDPKVLSLPGDVYLEGYFQSEKYFKDAEAQIRRDLEPRDDQLSAYASDYIKSRQRSDEPVVAVHVRRGDLAHSTEVLKSLKYVYGSPVTVDYIRGAMSEFDVDSTFLVFSDTGPDLDWCREHLSARKIHFCYGHTDLQDFALMRRCDHHVISNSTFSWWAAWLNPNPEKVVIAPRQWFDPVQYPDYDPASLIPAAWKLRD